MLQDMELVVDDLAPRRPLLNAQPEGFPHIHARRLNALPLPGHELATKEFIQGLLLPLAAKPQRCARLQIADHRMKPALLAPVDFVDSHLPEWRLAAAGLPML